MYTLILHTSATDSDGTSYADYYLPLTDSQAILLGGERTIGNPVAAEFASDAYGINYVGEPLDNIDHAEIVHNVGGAFAGIDTDTGSLNPSRGWMEGQYLYVQVGTDWQPWADNDTIGTVLDNTVE